MRMNMRRWVELSGGARGRFPGVMLVSLALAASLQAQQVSEAVRERETWKYLDTREAPADNWLEKDFDDSAWKEGSAPLGYGDDRIATNLDFGDDPERKPITVWLRKSFTIDDKISPDSLRLQFFRDDGAVIYLNGKEWIRSNMPAGFIDAKTTAVSFVNGSSESKTRSGS